jgi:hypothetical protein
MIFLPFLILKDFEPCKQGDNIRLREEHLSYAVLGGLNRGIRGIKGEGINSCFRTKTIRVAY